MSCFEYFPTLVAEDCGSIVCRGWTPRTGLSEVPTGNCATGELLGGPSVTRAGVAGSSSPHTGNGEMAERRYAPLSGRISDTPQ